MRIKPLLFGRVNKMKNYSMGYYEVDTAKNVVFGVLWTISYFSIFKLVLSVKRVINGVNANKF